METVLIAGGSGLIGSHLSRLLAEKGYTVIHLSRSPDPKAPFKQYSWNVRKESIAKEALERADYVIQLAGAGIADKRWTENRKDLIIESRIDSTQVLLMGFRNLGQQPKAFISASAIGYYGDRGQELLTEKSPPGQKGFLPKVCVKWEEAALQFAKWGVRTAMIRTGIVLSTQGGALEKMLPSYQLFTGAYFGNGEQYYSWIHLEDLCRIYIQAIENEQMTGPYNGVAPNPIKNKEMAKAIAEAMDKKALIVPVPEFALRLTMGEMADVVLDSARLSTEHLQKTGFEFKFPQFVPALKDLLKREI